MTKEPKLVRARQIPEWDTYDQEIARFAAKLSEEEGVLATSVDDLAAEKVVVVTGGGVGGADEGDGKAVKPDDGGEDGHRIADEL